MTNRERVLGALEVRTVDRFPVLTYNFHPFGGGWQRTPEGRYTGPAAYQDLMDTVFETGTGMLCKVSADRHSERGTRTTIETISRGSTVVRSSRMETPKGPLTSVYEAPPGQPGYHTKHYIETEEDLDRFASLPADTVRVDLSRALAINREIGDKGIAYLSYPDPMYDVAGMFDFEFFCVRCVTDLPQIRALVDREHERIKDELAAMLDQAEGDGFLFYTAGPEVLTPPMAAPSVFESLVVPYESELVRMIRSRGHFSSIHCHGRTRAVFDMFRDIGPHVVEPLEPPPQGDLELSEALDRSDGRMCIMGHIQDQDLYTAVPGEMSAKVRAVQKTVGDRAGYIMTSSASPFLAEPPPQYIRNYQEYLRAAARARGCCS